MKANYHTHTTRCQHADGTEREFIEAAIENGLQILGFSDHAPYTFGEGYCNQIRMDMSELEDYVTTILSLKEEYKKDITIYAGLELEYFPQFFEETYEKITAYPLEYLILSAHYFKNGHRAMGERAFVNPSDDIEYLTDYYHQLLTGMKMGCFTYVAHPDLLNFTGDEEILKANMRKLCREAKHYDMPLEINLHGFVTDKNYPNEMFWKIAGEEQCQVVMGIDAHQIAEFHYQVPYDKAMNLVQKYKLNLLEEVPLKNPRAYL